MSNNDGLVSGIITSVLVERTTLSAATADLMAQIIIARLPPAQPAQQDAPTGAWVVMDSNDDASTMQLFSTELEALRLVNERVERAVFVPFGTALQDVRGW